MEVVIFESAAFQKLEADIKTIVNYIKEQKDIHTKQAQQACDDEMWVDNYDERHVYYQIKEIRRMLENHLIRSNAEHLQNLIDNQRLYAEQRRNAKPHK